MYQQLLKYFYMNVVLGFWGLGRRLSRPRSVPPSVVPLFLALPQTLVCVDAWLMREVLRIFALLLLWLLYFFKIYFSAGITRISYS